ncbi:indole-3-acetate O-methyltransferase [Salvia divinorum]|uniref:Indole-3-acetate O-methyltransferase n=1 Tax=Salvia divinorum TaxID=28513 RepID=A0ABD1FJR0_SALDI
MDSKDNRNFSMNGGHGAHSYVKNSSYQGGVLEAAKAIIEEEIATKLEISTNSICVADFGCSTGSNSFPAMQAIIEAVKRKYESSGLKTLEFYVCFNDVVSNDFNTLFSSLPPDRSYEVAAVPGDFHGRLLPPSSVHFAYSSWALHWLTEVPKAAAGRHSPAWSGGESLYGVEREEVYEAYLSQFERDLEAFLKCRAVEMVEGGIMALLIPSLPNYWDPQKEFTVASVTELLRSSLVDMAKKGRLSETKLEAFNFPYYIPTPEQVWAILQKSNSFSIERMEIMKSGTLLTVDGHVACFRAVHQNMLTHEFGAETIDESTLVVVAVLKHKNA